MQNVSPIIVSVIITNFNYAHFLADALDSVLAQKLLNWECLIIDDGSTDNSKEIADKYTKTDNRFIYIYQHNQGLAAARNTGLSIAKGKYIQFLDADDKICSSKLFEQVKYLDENSDVDIVYGDFFYFETERPQVFFTSKNKDKSVKMEYPSGQGAYMLNKLIGNNFTVVSAPLLRSTVFKNGLKFDTSYNTFEDWKFWIDCSLADYTFQYYALAETETLIRFGHSSMMSALIKMNLGGQKIRKYVHPHLNFRQKLFNTYRMIKLIGKFYYLKTFGG